MRERLALPEEARSGLFRHTLVLTEYSVWELVRSPTLCGSPTKIWKVGLAACSTLMLGCVFLCVPSLVGGCTGGGIRGPAEGNSSSSSSRFTESIMLRIEDCDVAVVGRETREEACSFCGGTGGSSACDEAAKLSVEAPRGPKGSSTTSRRVGWGAA